MQGSKVRVDDSSAAIDWWLAHGAVVAALAFGALRHSPPALLIALLAGVRLQLHPLRFRRLHRVVLDRGRVLVAPMLGRAREVFVARVEHDGHSPWPCTLVLEDGTRASFVARRDDGCGAFFDLHPSDRARYERPSDARDSLTELRLTLRGPAPSAEPGTARRDDRA